MDQLSQNEILFLGQLGYTLYKEGQYQSAISLFEGLSDLQPESAQFHSVLTLLYHLTDQPNLALEHGLEALRQRPNDISLLITLAEIYLSLKRADHARDLLNRAYAEARQTGHSAINRIQLLLQSS